MTKRKYLHFRSTMVKTPQELHVLKTEFRKSFIQMAEEKGRPAQVQNTIYTTLCFTQSTQLQNNTMTLQYYSSLSLDTASSHKETPWMHQGSLPNFTDTPPHQAERAFSKSPTKEECVEEHCFRDVLPTVQFSAIIWEAYTTSA